MVDISIGCINENTYGISCVHCGNCGRKFTNKGINDGGVIHKEKKEYPAYLESKQIECIIGLESLNESIDC